MNKLSSISVLLAVGGRTDSSAITGIANAITKSDASRTIDFFITTSLKN
jgi:hypothetical protein